MVFVNFSGSDVETAEEEARAGKAFFDNHKA